MAGCTVHRAPSKATPRAEVKLNGCLFQALLDSGSAVSLVQPLVLPARTESKTLLPITCVHGDTHYVPTRRVNISASPGAWPVEVGIVKELPVPVLLGHDWPGFEPLLSAITQPVSQAGNRRRPKRPSQPCPALLTSDSARDARVHQRTARRRSH
ncbi:MAG: hypothetical protein ACRCVK_19360 [Aeromonas veronii]